MKKWKNITKPVRLILIFFFFKCREWVLSAVTAYHMGWWGARRRHPYARAFEHIPAADRQGTGNPHTYNKSVQRQRQRQHAVRNTVTLHRTSTFQHRTTTFKHRTSTVQHRTSTFILQNGWFRTLTWGRQKSTLHWTSTFQYRTLFRFNLDFD